MIVLRVDDPLRAASSLAQIKLAATRFPGDHELQLLAGGRRLTLGPEWRYDASPACLAALSEFGDAEVSP